ncbi:unnamed protein product [Mucor hiemalis]
MIFQLKLVWPALLLLAQTVKCYCVYNNFTDNTRINIVQRRGGISVLKLFSKNLETGSNACCSYSNADCSPRNDNSELVVFEVYFHWPRYTSERHIVQCLSGGGLSFYGNEKEHWAQCSDPSGAVTRVPILPDAIKS